MKEIRGWEEIIIEAEDGELIVDITAENYIAKDGYSIRLVPYEMDAQYEDDGYCHHGESEVEP